MSALEIVALVLVAWIALSALAAWAAGRRNPPLGEFVTVDGVRLHYLARGPKDARPLVILHGNGAMIQDFLIAGVIDRAAERFRVIVFDRPGFGHSSRPRGALWTPRAQADLIGKALDMLAVGEPIVLGHSWGTLVALALAGKRKVKGLVLASGYYFPTPRVDVWLMSGPSVPILGDLMAWTVAPVISLFLWPHSLKRVFAPRPVPATFEKRFPKGLALRPWSLRAVAEESAYLIPAAAQQSLAYSTLDCPAVVIAGDGDLIVEPDQAPRLKAMLPRALLRTEHGVGHMIHHASPDRIVEAVKLVEAWV